MKKYALIGHNIGYSLSPTIHSIIYGECSINACYDLISINPGDFNSSINSLRALDGFNITKPYKQDIIPFLLPTSLDSVNTVKVDDGNMIGYSTDGFGFISDINARLTNVKGNTLVLGAGGVAPAIITELKKMGLKVFIKNRTIEKARKLCDKYNISLYNGEKIDFIVNATSLGINNIGNPLDNSIDISNVKWVYDTIYSPPATLFMKSFDKAIVCNGLGMLIYQAIKADEIMCNINLSKQDQDKLFSIIYKEIKL